MDDQNEDSAQDRNAKNTSEQSSDKASLSHNVMMNIEGSKRKNNEDIPEEMSTLKNEVDACSDENTFLNDNVIIDNENSKHKNNEDMSEEISAFKKEVNAYIKDNTSLYNDVMVNVKDAKHKIIEVTNIEDKGMTMFKNNEDTPKKISAHKKEKNRCIYNALIEVLNYNMAWGGSGSDDDDDDDDDEDAFEYSPDRNSFVLKILSITFIMHLATVAFIFCAVLIKRFHRLLSKNGQNMTFVGVALILVVHYTMCISACCKRFAIIMALLSLIGYCVFLGGVAVHFESLMLGLLFMTTTILDLIYMILACTKFNFSKWYIYPMMVVVTLVSAVAGCTCTNAIRTGFFLSNDSIATALLVLLLGLLQNVMFNIALHVLLSGKTVDIYEDEVCWGAWKLYFNVLDIMTQVCRKAQWFKHFNR